MTAAPMQAQLIAKVRTPLSMFDVCTAFSFAYTDLEGMLPRAECLAALVGQSGHETAGWRSLYCYAFGNAKATKSHSGHYFQMRCWEIENGKKVWYDPPHHQTNFQGFLDAPSGAKALFGLLRRRYPQAWAAAQRGDIITMCDRLKFERAPMMYFTGDLGYYIRGTKLYAQQAAALIVDSPRLVQPMTGEEWDAFDPKTRPL